MAIIPVTQPLSNRQRPLNYFLAPTCDQIAYSLLKNIFFPSTARNLSTVVGLISLIYICREKQNRADSIGVYTALKVWQLIYRRWFLDPEDRKFENLLFADTFHHAGIVGEEVLKLWRDDKMSFQEIEQLLRRKNCDTFLIAHPRDDTFIPGMRIMHYTRVEKTYYLYLSCEYRTQAWRNQLQQQQAYRDNFANLNDTGVKQFAEGTTLALLRQMGGVVHLNERGQELFAAELPRPWYETQDAQQAIVP